MSEFLLQENPNRYVIFPIQYPDIWEMFQTHRKTFWTESEIDIAGDLTDWKKLNNNEKRFIKYVLAFFAASDGIVLENLALRFFKEIQIPEVRSFYSIQMFMETIHGIMYSQLIDTYIEDNSEKQQLFQAIETIPSVREKALWAQKWIEAEDSLAARIAAFACVEGIFFSGSFCCIYWLKERGVLPGLTKSNDFIARDEGLHTDFAILLYNNYIQNKLSQEKMHQLFLEATQIEERFITESLECHLLGMNADMMKEYIRFVSNRLLKHLNYKPLFEGVRQPFPFMDRICYDSKENFFEGRVTNYQMTVEKTKDDTVDDLNFDAYF